MDNKISIIMPTYGVEKYFRQCIESVINQSLKEIEIIPVDDGSPDNCGKIMDEYALIDSRIKPIHQQNAGYGRAVNVGIAKSSAPYIAIVETDDFIDKNMFLELYNKAIETGAEVTKAGFFHHSASSNRAEVPMPLDQSAFYLDDFPSFINNQPSIWSAIYKREWLINNNILMQETKGASFQDILFHLKTAFYAKKIALIHKSFYYYRIDNINSSVNSKTKNAMAILPPLETMSIIFKDNIKRYEKLKYSWFYCVIRYVDWNFYRLEKSLRQEFFYAAQKFINLHVTDMVKTQDMTNRQINMLKAFKSKLSYKEFLIISALKRLFYFNLSNKYGGIVIRVFGISIFEVRKSKNKTRYSILFIPIYKA